MLDTIRKISRLVKGHENLCLAGGIVGLWPSKMAEQARGILAREYLSLGINHEY